MPWTPRTKPAHHRGDHDRIARELTARANADPTTLCWRCHKPAIPGDPWQAGHVDGQPGVRLPEHRSCNQTAGARAAQAKRTQQRRPPEAHPGLTP